MTTKPLPPPVSPPPPKPGAAPVASTPNAADPRFAILSGKQIGAQRVLVYGPGGIGKSSLVALAPSPVFLDVESGTRELDVPRVEGIQTFADMRTVLNSTALHEYKTIVIDSATKAEELAVAHTLLTVPNERGQRVTSIEGYGFGRGLQFVYDTFLLLLADLDRHVRAGRNVILIAHDCVADAPNPSGENFMRYEPHLQSPKSGKNSIRNRTFQWADHVIFLGYDVMVEDGKGRGSGTRTLWLQERPDHVAKSRRPIDPTPWNDKTDGSIWTAVLGGAA